VKKNIFSIVLVLLVLSTQTVLSCSMFKITIGDKTMVGCNEDAWRLTSRIWFENATKKGNHGAAFTGSRSIGNNQFAPQSGMNNVGLSFSRLTAYHPIEIDNPIEKRKPISNPVSYLKDILHSCKTVKEVQQYIEGYDHSFFISDIFIYIDKNGDYLIVEPYSSKIGNNSYYVLSNFCPSITTNAENRKLAKYRNGEDFLRKHKLDTTLAFCTSLADTMHVCREKNGDGTLLSSIWDLKKGLVTLYFYHDYNYSIQYNLKEELLKGNHMIKIPALFPDNNEFERLTNYTTPFNTPFIRILLVFIGGFFFMSSLFFFLSYLLKKSLDKYRNLKLYYSVLGIIMTYYMFILATNIGIYYFNAPYHHYNNHLVSLSSYIPFLLLTAILPLLRYNFKVVKDKSWSQISIFLFTAHNIIYLILLGTFIYWGLFSL